MSGTDINNWHFLLFAIGYPVVCCVVGYGIDRLMVKLGWWRSA